MPDIEILKNVRLELANDPEKFSKWEHNFVESLEQRLEERGDGFGLSLKERQVFKQIMVKANN